MNSLEKFRDISTFIFDVDGVLADPLMHVLENGQLLRQMNSKDGFAFERALAEGYRIIIISGGKSEGVRIRLANLGVTEIYLSVRNKVDVLEDLVAYHDLDLGGALYMGDDLPDYECMRRVHFPVCPSDAAKEIIDLSQYVSPYRGGQGCARDVIEKTLTIQGKWKV